MSECPAWVRAYCRKSRLLGDPDDLDLMAHQVLPLKRAAEARGISLRESDIILEVGSSETIDERPAFRSLLREIEALPEGTGGLLFVWEISRLSRGSRPERARIADALERAGILVVTPTQTYDLSDPDSDFMFSVLSQQARREQVVYKRRIKDSREASLALGKIRNGRAPWGYLYDREAKTLLPHPERFPLLVACCREVLTESVRTLAERYGVPARVLQNTLTNPKICGWPAIISGKSKHGTTTTRLPRWRFRPAGRRNDTYPHACSREEFAAIQRVLAARAKHKTKTKGDAGWCRDLVWFPQAPGPVILGSTGGGPGRPCREVYERREKQNGRWRRLGYIERETVHTKAYAALRDFFTTPETLAKVAAAYEAYQQARRAEIASETPLARLQEETRALQQKYREAVNAEFDASPRLRAELTLRRQGLEAELDRLEAAVKARQEALAPDPATAALVARLPAIGAQFEAAWAHLSEAERRLLANVILARVVCRFEPKPRGVAWPRWVERVELQPWAIPR